MAVDLVKAEIDSEAQRKGDDRDARGSDVVPQAAADEASPPMFLEIKEFDQEMRKRVKNRVY